MTGILTQIRCAVQALVMAVFGTFTCAVLSIFLKLLQALPEQIIPQKVPRKFLKKGFGFGTSYNTFLFILHVKYRQLSCPITVGLKAPNINILTLEHVSKKLLDFGKAGRPLVVNFGSCS